MSRDVPCIVFVDADNTLWDTNRVYARAQEILLEDVEAIVGHVTAAGDRLAYVRAFDQAIAERHHAGLRYPPRLLAKAVALGLLGDVPEKAARLAWVGTEFSGISEKEAERVERRFIENLQRTPELRVGVREGLRILKNVGCALVVVTEGNRDKVLRLIVHYGLDRYIERTIEGKKQPRLFQRLVHGVAQQNLAVMIGDQLDRDIRPAKEAGLMTVLFPGGFSPRWLPGEKKIAPDYKVASLAEAAQIIESILVSETKDEESSRTLVSSVTNADSP